MSSPCPRLEQPPLLVSPVVIYRSLSLSALEVAVVHQKSHEVIVRDSTLRLPLLRDAGGMSDSNVRNASPGADGLLCPAGGRTPGGIVDRGRLFGEGIHGTIRWPTRGRSCGSSWERDGGVTKENDGHGDVVGAIESVGCMVREGLANLPQRCGNERFVGGRWEGI